MSYTAIAAVLARTDLSIGERLVALSLSSFANREERAWPSNATAAACAGLGRSQYLEARAKLVARGLIAIESTGRGRGQSTTLVLLFAQFGPWWEGEVNAPLVERVLTHSQVRGPGRLLLATLAALADDSGVVGELTTAELCRAAGLADSTYRRARNALLDSGEIELVEDGGGRGRMNRWRVLEATRVVATRRATHRRRRPPVPRQPPLLSPVRSQPSPALAVAGARQKGPDLSGVSAQKGPNVTAVSPEKRPGLTGVSGANPAKTPPETPPPHARAGNKPLNPRTRNPPNPPQGGNQLDWVGVEETYVSDRGRRRRRSVSVDLNGVRRGLYSPTGTDRNDWRRIRDQLERAVGEDTFAIWLAPIELIATDAERRLLVAAPAATAAWTSQRYSGLLTEIATQIKRDLRFATDTERHAVDACPSIEPMQLNPKEATG